MPNEVYIARILHIYCAINQSFYAYTKTFYTCILHFNVYFDDLKPTFVMIPYFRISQVQMVTRLCCFISPTLVMISYFIIIHDIFAV